MAIWDRYWDDPQVLQKLSAAMGDAFNPEDANAEAAAPGHQDGAEEEEEEGSEELATVASAASSGACLQLRHPASLCACYLSACLLFFSILIDEGLQRLVRLCESAARNFQRADKRGFLCCR